MINELYEYLNLLNIKGNAKLDNIFFNAIRKHNELLDLENKRKQNESMKNSETTMKEETKFNFDPSQIDF